MCFKKKKNNFCFYVSLVLIFWEAWGQPNVDPGAGGSDGPGCVSGTGGSLRVWLHGQSWQLCSAKLYQGDFSLSLFCAKSLCPKADKVSLNLWTSAEGFSKLITVRIWWTCDWVACKPPLSPVCVDVKLSLSRFYSVGKNLGFGLSHGSLLPFPTSVWSGRSMALRF